MSPKSITVIFPILLTSVIFFICCSSNKSSEQIISDIVVNDTVADPIPTVIDIKPEDIKLEKKLAYDKHTLLDIYPYKDTLRSFQWHKIKDRLALVENIQQLPAEWGVLQNYKNKNGEAPLVKTFKRNEYKRVSDTLGVERYQSVPLYSLQDTITPVCYGRDGSLVKIINNKSNYIKVQTVFNEEKEWTVPKKYLKSIGDTIIFNKAIFIHRKNQNVATLEKSDSAWHIMSMNPATTGIHRPPHKHETPEGMYIVQEKKVKMFYLVDGTTEIGGYAPSASRFTNGAHIHGIPIDLPRTEPVEFSASLGTTPRSHMCVRTPTSHAKYIFDWAPTYATLVFVFD